tara:strand:- start:262 stop:1452 length:1191 start_codon:yes stop_codon:yes gene_type:complete
MLNKINFRIRFILLFITLLCAFSFFSINWYLVKQLRLELNKQVNTIVEIYHDKLTNENIDSEYLLKILIPLINDLDIPMIITTKKTDGSFSYEYINLNLSHTENDIGFNQIINSTIKAMDSNNPPLTVIEVDGQPIIEIHYGDSVIIENLKWISFIEFGFIFFIIILFIVSFYLILSNEKNYIYAGMAKEAAHQLGTPISSLLGWLKLLEKNNVKRENIYESMMEDVKKLNNISHKFNKIGSVPKLSNLNLIDLLCEVVDYYNAKIPKAKNIIIKLNYSEDEYIVKGDKILLYWSFENIIKNSIDSIYKKQGKIDITLNKNKNNIYIDITDSGKGISRKNRRKIFNAGFSTKTRGWGLGLNLSKRIIQKIHNGTIVLLASNNEKTTFRIKLLSSIP